MQLLALLRQPDVRLVTLTGPGGIGKTRLLLALGNILQNEFIGGVCFVPLAAISDPDFVPLAIAQALGLREESAEALFSDLQDTLGEQCMLLLLDNFEQVLSAAPLLSELGIRCPSVTLLVSSRAALRLNGEYEFTVPPLALPDLTHSLLSAHTLTHYAACALFVQRLQAIKPSFRVTEANALAIAEVCLRLDGLPLALELAAARTRTLSLRELTTRLSHRLEILTGGARDLPERQQTLRATLAWSYQLLTPQQQRLFRWLAICADGCTLQAAETLALAAGYSAGGILDGLSVLLENHLLRQLELPDEEPRLLMLETLREYGLECLQSAGEMVAAQQAHARYYLALAQEAEQHLAGPEQVYWLDRLEQEQENVRAVLQCVTTGDSEDIELALHLGTSMARFWYVRGHVSDGHRWLDWVQAERRGNAIIRAKALNQAARLAIWRDEYELAQVFSNESLELYKQEGNIQGIASSFFSLGDAAQDRSNYAQARLLYQEALRFHQQIGDQQGSAYALAAQSYGAASQGNFANADTLAEEALALFRAQEDKQGILYALVRLIRCLYFSQSDLLRARSLAQECLVLSREVGYKQGIAAALSYSGLLALHEGDALIAQNDLEEALQLRKELGSPWGMARGMYYLAEVKAVQHDYATAQKLYENCLVILCKIDDREFLASCLEELAATWVARNTEESSSSVLLWAAQVWGAAERLRAEIDAPLPPVHYGAYMQAMMQARRRSGERAWHAAWTRGRNMTAQQAMASAPEDSILSDLKSPAPPVASAIALTNRETQVLCLLAEGLTNPQIAARLVVSLPTIGTHVASIFNKLGVNSRSAATRYALEHSLI